MNRARRRVNRVSSIPRYYKKEIAPRLKSGDRREAFGHGLPPEIKEGLRRIAWEERESVSWVVEKIIVDWIGHARDDIRTPEYKERKGMTAPAEVS
jgi:hypothetical protein